jgi:hypothetical protein
MTEAERHQRVAENESIFRDINERIEASHIRFRVRGPQEFLCECGDAGCTDRVYLTLAEYEKVRAHPARFAVVTGHEIEGVEDVVERDLRFSVVEKTGVGATVAAARDPRAALAADQPATVS